MVRIITDSAADFEPEELERLRVTCVPISVSFGDIVYHENVDLSKDLFYRLLETEPDFPCTAQPSPYAYECIMEDAMEHGDEAVVITLSSALSGTYQTAVMMKNVLEYENCYVVDSRTATGGQRILVEQAVKLRQEGKSTFEIAQALRALVPRITLYACIDTLEYLYRGGRITGSVHTVGSVLRLKPILRVTPEGKVDVFAKRLGLKNAMEYLCKKALDRPPDEAYPFYVMYTHNPNNGLLLAEYLREQGHFHINSNPINVGAAIGSHIGPNACGFVYVAAQ